MGQADVNLRKPDPGATVMAPASMTALSPAAVPAATSAPPSSPVTIPADTDQETDVWWGSWSGWMMLPSLVVSVVLTGVIVWWAWTYVDRRFVQLTIWALAGLVWLVQLGRWSWHWFGHNYRLTTRRLIVWRGHLRRVHLMAFLTELEHVRVEDYIHSRWTGVGRIVVALQVRGEPRREEVELDGVKNPREVAELIRTLNLRARTSRSLPPG
jgi:hypothetical protein